MTCNMDPRFHFDAVADDEDLVYLGTQTPHLAASILVKNYDNPKHMKPSIVFHAPVGQPLSMAARDKLGRANISAIEGSVNQS